MKYLVAVLVIVLCGLAYLWFEQPETWNQYFGNFVKAGNPAALPGASDTVSGANTNAAPKVVSPPKPPPPVVSEIISPDSSNYINPDHVHPVEQPTQPVAAPETNAPAGAAPTSPGASP